MRQERCDGYRYGRSPLAARPDGGFRPVRDGGFALKEMDAPIVDEWTYQMRSILFEACFFAVFDSEESIGSWLACDKDLLDLLPGERMVVAPARSAAGNFPHLSVDCRIFNAGFCWLQTQYDL
ncbi:hypothetical protein Mapa_016962 [Marchantia paleacea]|nr:hypothetical protein Mapa_016962 [Marchantia paleacea]